MIDRSKTEEPSLCQGKNRPYVRAKNRPYVRALCQGGDALDSFAEKWDGKYPKIAQSWRDNWPNLSTYFKYPEEVRRLIYTTNAIGASTGSSAR